MREWLRCSCKSLLFGLLVWLWFLFFWFLLALLSSQRCCSKVVSWRCCSYRPFKLLSNRPRLCWLCRRYCSILRRRRSKTSLLLGDSRSPMLSRNCTMVADEVHGYFYWDCRQAGLRVERLVAPPSWWSAWSARPSWTHTNSYRHQPPHTMTVEKVRGSLPASLSHTTLLSVLCSNNTTSLLWPTLRPAIRTRDLLNVPL